MTQHPEPGPPPAAKRERGVDEFIRRRVERKREKLRTEIQRNRKGEHAIPTWVLTVVLVVIVAGLAYLIITS